MAFPRSGMQISTPSDGKIGQCIREANIPILLREDKLEFELGGPDAYMQLARCYDLVVGVLTNSIEIDSNANNYLTHGAPCFLWVSSVVYSSLHLLMWFCLGLMLFVCGGFHDSHKPVIEPLAKPVFMLNDHTRTRQAEVATLLWALVRGISSLRRWGHDENVIPLLPLSVACQARD